VAGQVESPDNLCPVKDGSGCGGSNPHKMRGAAQMALVEDDDVVQALAPDRADHTLDVGVLPR